MARAKVVHSEDACEIVFEGNKFKKHEPHTGVITFPGGHVEVTRCSDNTYWAHISITDGTGDHSKDGKIIKSRFDYNYETAQKMDKNVVPIPEEQGIEHIAIRIAKQ
jgi:hypothetical protein